jgi:hypothetical protein
MGLWMNNMHESINIYYMNKVKKYGASLKGVGSNSKVRIGSQFIRLKKLSKNSYGQYLNFLIS